MNGKEGTDNPHRGNPTPKVPTEQLGCFSTILCNGRYSSGALTNLALVRDLPKTIHPQFNYCESIPLLERAAIILLKTVGETHPNTVSTINSLRDAKNNKVRDMTVSRATAAPVTRSEWLEVGPSEQSGCDS